MSIVSESNPWCDITSAENALGMASQPFTTASPRAQISLSLLARTADSPRAPRRPGPGLAYCTPFARARRGRAHGFPGRRERHAATLDDARRGAAARRLKALEQQVTAVAGVRPDLRGPAALLDSLGPGVGKQHVGALQLVEVVEARGALGIHRPALAAEHHREGPCREPRRGDDARHREDQRDVLAVVHLVEQLLAVGAHVHRGGEQIATLARHGLVPPLQPGIELQVASTRSPSAPAGRRARGSRTRGCRGRPPTGWTPE